jgi:hypothetical protein
MNYQHIQRWARPDYYIGAQWDSYYVVLGQHRDSGSIDRSNYAVILADLETLDREHGGERTVFDTRASHWAVGWVETILVHESNIPALERADEWCERLADYPLADEDHHSELVYNEAAEIWERASLRDRLEMLRFGSGEEVSVFAIRRDELPSLDYMSIVDGC